VATCRKPIESGLSSRDDTPSAIPQAILPVIAPPAPPLGVIGSAIQSTAKAWDSSCCLTEFLEGLKSSEVDQKGNHFSFSTALL
jgi:hypothetical protein